MKTILILISLFFSSFLFSQNINLQWAKNNTNSDRYSTSKNSYVDSNENIYVVGEFKQTIDLDPSINISNYTSNGDMDVFISKFDKNGNYLWGKTLGGINSDNVTSISNDSIGNIIISGYFTGIVDFDPNNSTYNLSASGISNSFFILKLTTDGNFIWAKNIGKPSITNGDNLKCDSIGNIYIYGVFNGTQDFDPSNNVYNLTSHGNISQDNFILKLDSNGNFIWVRSFYSDNDSQNARLISISKNYIYLLGEYNGNMDFDPSSQTTNIYSQNNTSYISKFDANGNFIWAKTLYNQNNGQNKINSIKIDQNDNIYLIGWFNSSVDFDPSIQINIINPPNSYYYNHYILKLNKDGNFVWVKSILSSGSLVINSFDIDKSNNIFIVGSTFGNGDTDFDTGTGILLKNILGGFILKLNSTADFVWLEYINTINTGGEITIEKINLMKNAIYINGLFRGNSDFDTGNGTTLLNNINNSVIGDGYTAKYSTCINSSNTITTSNCETYTAPDGQIFTNSGTYNVTIPNKAGCDSLITINLTIKHNTLNTITTANCETYTAPNGQVFTNSGTYNVTIPNKAGCDSLITINLTIKHNSLNTITTANCETYTAPDGQIFTNSGTYNVTIPNKAGCDSLITINLTINRNPTVFAGNDTSVCEKSIINLQGHGANNYVWNKNIINNVSFTPLNSGYYTVIGTDLNGCSDSDSVLVSLFQLPIANFTNSTNSISDISQTIDFINTSSGAIEYLWNFGDGIFDSTVNVSHNFNIMQLDSFKVELIAISTHGCVDSAYRWIYFTKSNDIFIPTGFSPNNDNQNDDWKIKGIEKYNEAKISVFNRWGQLLFEGNNIKSSWNGIYNNELLPTGDYYFIIDLGNNQKYNGVVTLKK